MVVLAGYFDDLRNDREGADAARVPCRVLALRDDQVEAGLKLALGLPREADQPPDLHAGVVHLVEDERGTAHAGGEDRDLLLHHDLELRAGVAQAAQPHVLGGRSLGVRDVVVAHQLLDPVAVALGDLLLELLLVAAHVGRRDRDVGAKGAVADALLDPLDVGSHLIDGVRAAAEHADRAGVRGGGDDVAGVGKCDDRVLGAVLLAETGAQRVVGHHAVLSRAAPQLRDAHMVTPRPAASTAGASARRR